MFRHLITATLILAVGQSISHASDVERVYVVSDAKAPELERFAATELAGQFRRLFQNVEVVPTNKVPAAAKQIVLIGSPATNSALKQTIGSNWPKVTDQGIVLKSVQTGDANALVVGGDTPEATLWAAYELGQRFGVRYMLREDIFPLEKQPLKLDGFDVTLEPQLRTRTWRTINDFCIGPESWGLADHKKFLGQLAKLKYNDLMLSVYPWQPFVDYEFGGVKKQTATQWFGDRFRVDGDTVGKKAFGGAKVFENPDFAGKTGHDEMTAAGIKHARGIIAEARKLGMTVGISISPLEFPREFQKVLPGSQVATGLNQLTILPGAKQGPNDKRLKQAVAAKIRAYLKTYPSIEKLYLTLPEFPEWDQHAGQAWKQLLSQRDLGDVTLAQLVATARDRKLIASGKRGEQALKGNVEALAFLNNLFKDESLLTRADGGKVELVVTGVDPALFPLLDRILPAEAATLHFIDYTARRVAEHKELLALVPAKKVRSQLILTLADDNVGILPQSSLGSLGTLMDELKRLGWDGFSTRYWIPAELDSSVHFLAQSAWHADLTPKDSYFDLWETITDNKSATERMWLGEQHLQQATALIDKHDIGFTFPVKGMLMKHYRAEKLPDWWQEANDHYTQMMIELYRVNGSIDPRATKITFYYAKRGEYVLTYLAAVKATREAAIAKKNGDTEKTIEHLETAVESMYDTITTVADVATDQSDRGLIAVLNEFAYRPLLAEFEKLLDAE
jgi:hypothetical protein